MREVRRSALVPETPEQMYALVSDVVRYPEFVPYCVAARVLEASAESVRATLEMRRAGIGVSLTTQNTLRPGEHIGLALADGPFSVFVGSWDFVAIRAPGEGATPGPVRGCRVELLVRFEFRNAAVGLLAGPLFESTWNTLVDAFVRRAREVYGRGR